MCKISHWNFKRLLRKQWIILGGGYFLLHLVYSRLLIACWCINVVADAGERCEVNIDECQSHPCYNNAICIDLIASYNCRCQPGFHGTHCQLRSEYRQPLRPVCYYHTLRSTLMKFFTTSKSNPDYFLLKYKWPKSTSQKFTYVEI